MLAKILLWLSQRRNCTIFSGRNGGKRKGKKEEEKEETRKDGSPHPPSFSPYLGPSYNPPLRAPTETEGREKGTPLCCRAICQRDERKTDGTTTLQNWGGTEERTGHCHLVHHYVGTGAMNVGK